MFKQLTFIALDLSLPTMVGTVGQSWSRKWVSKCEVMSLEHLDVCFPPVSSSDCSCFLTLCSQISAFHLVSTMLFYWQEWRTKLKHHISLNSGRARKIPEVYLIQTDRVWVQSLLCFVFLIQDWEKCHINQGVLCRVGKRCFVKVSEPNSCLSPIQRRL